MNPNDNHLRNRRRPPSTGVVVSSSRPQSQLPSLFEEPTASRLSNSVNHRQQQHHTFADPKQQQPSRMSPRNTFARTAAFMSQTSPVSKTPTSTQQSTSNNTAQPQNQDNLKSFLDVFNSHDTESTGFIPASVLPSVFTALNKNISNINERVNSFSKTKEGFFTFDELLSLLSLVSQSSQSLSQHRNSTSEVSYTLDSKVVEYLRMLGEYRRKCEDEGNYNDARKAHDKINEIKRKESLRQKHTLRLLQEGELNGVDDYQKTSMDEFAKAWDNYVAEYEATAYLSLEKMKERHQQEIETFVAQLKEEFFSKIKASKQLLALRHKEKLLVKMKQYAEAELVKQKADRLQEEENAKNHSEIKEKIKLQVATLRKNQTQVMQVLMKRIQTDRMQQAQQRQLDSTKLINRNRNFRNDLLHKQSAEVKRAMESIKENLNMQEEEQPNSNFTQIIDSNRQPTQPDPYGNNDITGEGSQHSGEANHHMNRVGRSTSEANALYQVDPKLFSNQLGSKPRTSSRRLRSTSYNGRKFKSKQNDSSYMNTSLNTFQF